MKLKFSIAWFNIIWFIFPDFPIKPSLSNLSLVFFLIHSSIKQLPGPISNASKFFFEPSSFLTVLVMLDIPPIFKKLGHSIFFLLKILLDIRLWKIGVNGAPWPPLF